MPGTIIFRPIQANFNSDHSLSGKLCPYCEFKLGWRSIRSSVANDEDCSAEWKEEIVLKKHNKEHFAQLKIKDKEKDKFWSNGTLGEAKINLEPVVCRGKVLGWYNFYRKNKLAGEVLLEVEYVPED